MRLEIHLTAYDVMDQVQLVLSYRALERDDDPLREWIPLVNTMIPGEGITDPRQWAQDALVGVMEKL